MGKKVEVVASWIGYEEGDMGYGGCESCYMAGSMGGAGDDKWVSFKFTTILFVVARCDKESLYLTSDRPAHLRP